MHEFSLTKDVDDMDESEVRATLADFMDKHAENVEAYEALESEAAEYSENVEALESDLETAQAYFAEKASDYTHLDASVIVERFSLDETIEMAGEAEAAFAEDEADETDEEAEFSEDEADEDEESESIFAEKPEKAPVSGSEGKSSFADQAKDDLDFLLG